MKLATLEAIFQSLNDAGVRYLVAGGIAVNIHGYQRMTADLDLVIQLDTENALTALRCFANLGYKPTLPVNAEQFAEPEIRNSWITQKNMQVFSLISAQHPETTIDLFVEEPFNFDTEYDQATLAELTPDIILRVVRIPTLIQMKKTAGRPRDEDDIQHLRIILEENDG